MADIVLKVSPDTLKEKASNIQHKENRNCMD